MSSDAGNAGGLAGELARRRSKDPFGVLGVGPEASGRDVRNAFLELTKKFHPTRFARLDRNVRDTATELFLLIKRAHDQLDDEEKRRLWREKLSTGGNPLTPPLGIPSRTLTPPVGVPSRSTPPLGVPMSPATSRLLRPRPPVRPAPAPQPKPEVQAMLESARTRGQRFEDARRLLRKGEHQQAREAFHRIAAEDPHSKRYRAHLHWAWGLEHRTAGRIADAVRELERAQSFDPENDEIARELAKTLEARAKGTFSKLLGR